MSPTGHTIFRASPLFPWREKKNKYCIYPVYNHPLASIVLFVFSSSSQYPNMTPKPRTHSSPSSPTGIISPFSFTTLPWKDTGKSSE